MSSYRYHDELKQDAKKLLLSLGFKESEIKFEYRVPLEDVSKRTKQGVPKSILIDVAGIKPNHRVAVECGSIYSKRGKRRKIRLIRENFDRFFWIRGNTKEIQCK